MIDFRDYEMLTFDAADERVGGELAEYFNEEYSDVLFIPGDVTVDGHFVALLDHLDGMRHPDSYDLLVVAGDLTVSGRLQVDGEFPGLYVGGYTRALTLETGDAEVRINDATITHLVHGYHNDTSLHAGTVHTPCVIRDGHLLDMVPRGAIVVENHYHWDSEGADITRDAIAESFLPEVVDKHSRLDMDVFIERVLAGLPVLRPGVRGADADTALSVEERATSH